MALEPIVKHVPRCRLKREGWERVAHTCLFPDAPQHLIHGKALHGFHLERNYVSSGVVGRKSRRTDDGKRVGHFLRGTTEDKEESESRAGYCQRHSVRGGDSSSLVEEEERERKEEEKPRPGCRIGGVARLKGLRGERQGLLVVASIRAFWAGGCKFCNNLKLRLCQCCLDTAPEASEITRLGTVLCRMMRLGTEVIRGDGTCAYLVLFLFQSILLLFANCAARSRSSVCLSALTINPFRL